jgi:ABC-type sugar transport system substrate-binding protein
MGNSVKYRGVIALGAAIVAAPFTAASAAEVNVPQAAQQVQMPWGEFKLAPRIINSLKEGKPANIIVDVMATAIPRMGTEMRAGMERACGETVNGMAMSCDLVGPINTDPNQQLSQLETLLASEGVDCLVLQTPLPGQFVRVIDKFVDQGIPVFTFNIDVDKSKRFAFTALNEEEAGRVNGVETAKLVKAKNLAIDTVAVASSAPDQAWARSRMKGFIAGYKEVIPDAKFFNDADKAVPTGLSYSVKETLTTMTPFLTAHPEVNLVFHSDQSVEGVSEVIRNLKLQGKVFTSGFNVSRGILSSINDDVTLVTIDQNYAAQTNTGVNQCAAFLTAGDLPKEQLNFIPPVVISKDGEGGSLKADVALKDLQSSK